MKAYLTMRSKSDADVRWGFEWSDAATLVLPQVGDEAAMYQKRPKRVMSRSFSYVVDSDEQRVDIELVLE